MKFPSAFIAAFIAASMLIPAFPAKADTTLSVTVLGDLDLNNRFTLSDLVTMQKYLLGKALLNEQAFINSDINSDGCADIFDMCLLRKKLISESGDFTRIVSDLQYSDEIHNDPRDSYIFSVHDLYGYFSPLHVISVEGDCFDVPTYTDEDIEKYAAIYDEEFFKDNILLLKTEPKPDGGENNIGNVYYSGDHIKAEFYQTYSGERTNSYENHFQLLQIVIPRTLDIAKDYDWVYRYPDVKAKVTTEFTREVSTDCWNTAIYGTSPEYFSFKSSFDKWIEGKFHSAVERTLKKRYNEEFFAQNDLVIDLNTKDYGRMALTAKAEVTSDKVTLTYSRELADIPYDDGVYITQTVIPKGSCYYHNTEAKLGNTNKVQLDYKEFDIGMLCMTYGKDMEKAYNMEPRWVSSQEELDEYLEEYLTDDAIELIDMKLKGHTAYVWFDGDMIGATHKLLSSYVSRDEKTIELNTATKEPFGDVGGTFLHILYTSGDMKGYNVNIRNFDLDENYPTFDKYPLEIDFGDDSNFDSRTLFINQYNFGGEYSADFYLTHAGGGPIRYRSYEYLGTVELSPHYEPFSGEHKTSESKSEGCSITGEGFTITYYDGTLKVSCRTSPGSEQTSLEFDIGQR